MAETGSRGTGNPAGSAGAQVPPPPEGGSIVDAATELVQAVVTYLRQETGDLVREKVVVPIQNAGLSAGLAIAAGLLAAIGGGFIAVALLILLARFITWPGALFLIGLVMMVAAFIIIRTRAKKVQKV